MRIDLRGTDIGMAQKFLYHPQICPIYQHMRGRAVAQGMRMHMQADTLAVSFDDAPKAATA